MSKQVYNNNKYVKTILSDVIVMVYSGEDNKNDALLIVKIKKRRETSDQKLPALTSMTL